MDCFFIGDNEMVQLLTNDEIETIKIDQEIEDAIARWAINDTKRKRNRKAKKMVQKLAKFENIEDYYGQEKYIMLRDLDDDKDILQIIRQFEFINEMLM